MKKPLANAMRLLSALCLLSIIGVGVWYFVPQPRAALYSVYRERGKFQALSNLNGYQNQTSDHFSIWYTAADEKIIPMVIETAERVYQPVVKEIGYRPDDRVPIIIYSSRDELRSAFGWSKTESAMGVYWAGTIRLLSPNVWAHAKSTAEQAKIFAKLNPIAHEFTHYCLDYYTSGNYPRWFTEGFAQRVEYHITGYLWLENSSSLRQDLYSFDDMQGRFDQLRNQPLAYRQSYLLVDYMAKTYGEERFTGLVQQLGQGVAFPKAVEQSYGRPLTRLFADWDTWLHTHMDQVEPKES